MMDLTQYIVAAPEMTLLGLICIVLVADLFVPNERRVLTYWMSLASLGITLWVLLATAPAGRVEVFSGSYVSDGLSQALKISVTGLVAENSRLASSSSMTSSAKRAGAPRY